MHQLLASDPHSKVRGVSLIIGGVMLYTLFCFLMSRVFRKVPTQSLRWGEEWAFMPVMNVYILSTKLCRFSDIYFCVMCVATLTTGVVGLAMWVYVLFTLGALFDHGRCWSFWWLFVAAPIGFAYLAFSDDAYFRWGPPILEPPDAVFARASASSQQQYAPPNLANGFHQNEENAVYFKAPDSNIQLVEVKAQSEPPKDAKWSAHPLEQEQEKQSKGKFAEIGEVYHDEISSAEDVL